MLSNSDQINPKDKVILKRKQNFRPAEITEISDFLNDFLNKELSNHGKIIKYEMIIKLKDQ